MAQGKKHIKNYANEQIVTELLLKGYNYTQVSEKLGICTKTLHKNYSDTIKSIEILKDINDLKDVKNSLLKKCLGYKIKEREYIYDKEGSKILRGTKTKKIVASDTAIIFYLVNKSNGEFVSINKPNNEMVDNSECLQIIINE